MQGGISAGTKQEVSDRSPVLGYCCPEYRLAFGIGDVDGRWDARLGEEEGYDEIIAAGDGEGEGSVILRCWCDC